MVPLRPLILVLLAWGALAAMPTAPAPAPVDEALLALHQSGARSPAVLEAVVAAGDDPRDWHGGDLLGAIAVAAPDEDPITGLRAAYAVLSAGADPYAWDDPVRGRVDLAQQLQQNVARALESPNDAVASFQILAMAAGGLEVPSGLRGHLLSLRSVEGSWGCGPWHGPECTGYALAALAASGGVPPDVAADAAAYIQGRSAGDAFADPLNGQNVQVTVWAVQALRLAGADAPPAAVEWVLAQQGHDGLWRQAGRPSAWATAEAVVMLSGGHPLG